MPKARSLSVQSKLIGAFVALTLTAIVVMSWIGYVSARDSLRASRRTPAHGPSTIEGRSGQTILTSARNEVLSLSASQAARMPPRELLPRTGSSPRSRSLTEMRAGVTRFYREEFEPALTKQAAFDPPDGSLLPTTPAGWYLHYHYVATGPKPYGARRAGRSATDRSAYGQAVARCCRTTGRVDRLGLEDIILVDPETLDVFFSLEQSSVLGTNLINGPYAASRLSNSRGACAIRRTWTITRWPISSLLPGTWQAEGLCRHAGLRRSAHSTQS